LIVVFGLEQGFDRDIRPSGGPFAFVLGCG
jgi:hypothetical protein